MQITAEIKDPMQIQVVIQHVDTINADMGSVTMVNPGTQRYDGPYTVTPKMEGQELETKNKLMTSNVIVEAVPVRRTANEAGGNTVYIAAE